MLITGTARIQDLADAINHSQVHRLVLKPGKPDDLLQMLRTTARTLLLERSHEHLLEELRNLNLDLEHRVQTRTEELRKLNLELEQRVQLRTEELRKLNLELEERVWTRTQQLQDALAKLQQANAALEEANKTLEKMATTDTLTELANRRAIDDTARAELRRRERTPAPLALVMIDADHFGQVNRDHSLTAGDQVLKWLSGILQASIRATDALGRVGGEEFMVVAPATDRAGAEKLAERLRANVESSSTEYVETTEPGGGEPETKVHTIRMTISLGVAVVDATTPIDFDQMRKIAVNAEKEAKETGRNRAVIRLVPPAAPATVTIHLADAPGPSAVSGGPGASATG